MNKTIIILTIALLLAGCVYAENSTVKINGIEFEIPLKYRGGDVKTDGYELDNTFTKS